MYKKILLAYDGTREGRTVLREGAELAAKCGAEVHLLAVLHPDTGILFAEAAEPSGLADVEALRVEQVLAEGLANLQKRGLKAESTLCKGDPTAEILSQVERIGADLIVLGHHRRNAFTRWWRGSVDEELLSAAPCSLLITVGSEED